ncbi:uncharacterized protein LOC105840641 isoform X2 [Monomorium pharaonis]|uniref:uncharacterized protein LOC105840641 isoform X2 n=1 Tax=Monomorium pharaonis TaxID=307658 RepID=UPI00063F0CAD|nr:uncharacterized protein LOC105840641 isoform X2 [Monomorium pharaonis]
MAEKCKECGCKCSICSQDNQQHCDMHLHAEIENLRQRLLERDNHIVTMETQFLNEADKFPNGELASMKEELLMWQEKYSRLHEAHKRVQKVNQNLEDKLLRIVDKCETEKGAFTKDIATLSHRLADANYTIHRLTHDNEKYRNDVSLAIQLLQCKPSNFVGHKYDSLPSEVQAKVRTYVAQKRCSTQDMAQPDVKSITVPISTFPPTAMVYNISKPTVEKHSDDDSDDSKPPMDMVSAAIMAKVLEDREKERIFAKHCDTCTCHRNVLTIDTETQTYVPDTFPISEGYAHSAEKQASEGTSNGQEKYQSKDKSNLTTHAVFYEINENVNKIRHHMNGDCVKYAVSQVPCIKDKFVSRSNRNAQDYATTEDNITKASLNKKNSSQGHENKRSCSRLNDLNRINVDKTSKPLRANKCDSPTVDKSAKYSNKSEKNFFEHLDNDCLAPSDNRLSDKEQMHIDIINDRLWKNEWTKLKSEMDSARESKCKMNRGIEFDIINDRDWKNDRWAERQNTRTTAQFTVIEIKSPDNNVNHNDGSQTGVTTSPSFSSDSMVISSSDPSSSCSDVVQSLTGGAFNSSTKSNSSQNRVTGPRNCLVRVTSGSKNILLDNAGHYKTVLYNGGSGGGSGSGVGGNGGNGKISTALVHAKKTSRAGSERSTSTASEDNSTPPVLLQDNQLQRVAEWVQSSMCVENSALHDSNKIKCVENAVSDNTLSSLYLNDPLMKRKSSEQAGDLDRSVRDAPNKSSKNVENYNEKNVNNEPNNIDILAERIEQDESKNLITFEDEHLLDSRKDLDYEVKVTKEMEETYLKLAASLDPVTLSLSSTSNAELTIEKYRKDHKRLYTQRVQDKAGSKA